MIRRLVALAAMFVACATPPIVLDAAGDSTAGVPCGSQVCTGSFACCIAAAPACQDQSNGGGKACPSNVLYRCDGPEDCPSGQSCLATGGDGTQWALTRCEPHPDYNISGAGVLICHASSDCVAGATCTPLAVPTNGAPPLSQCE